MGFSFLKGRIGLSAIVKYYHSLGQKRVVIVSLVWEDGKSIEIGETEGERERKKRDGGLKRHQDLIHNIAPISIILSTRRRRRRRRMLLEISPLIAALCSVRWTVPIAFHGPADRHSAPLSKHSTLIFYDQYSTSKFYMVYCKSTTLLSILQLNLFPPE